MNMIILHGTIGTSIMTGEWKSCSMEGLRAGGARWSEDDATLANEWFIPMTRKWRQYWFYPTVSREQSLGH